MKDGKGTKESNEREEAHDFVLLDLVDHSTVTLQETLFSGTERDGEERWRRSIGAVQAAVRIGAMSTNRVVEQGPLVAAIYCA